MITCSGMPMSASSALDSILQNPYIWRGDQYAKVVLESIPTGYSVLDEQLPGGGWPRAAMTEILLDRQGIGGFSLLAPALSRLSKNQDWIALIAPPYIPYASALVNLDIDLSKIIIINPVREEDKVWATERCLRSKSCSAVLFWPSAHNVQSHQIYRRLQLAAEAGEALGVVFGPTQRARHTSPVSLRLLLSIDQSQLRIHLLKRRGGGSLSDVYIRMKNGANQKMKNVMPLSSSELLDSHSKWRQSVA
jgi:hypothetical protein